MKNILVVTDQFDTAVQPVIESLESQGCRVFRLNPVQIPLEVPVAARLGGSTGSTRIRFGGVAVDLHGIDSIWYRKPLRVGGIEGMGPREEAFAEGELRHFMKGLWSQASSYWMSRLDLMLAAENKLDQLRRAREIGFSIPRTLISNEIDEVCQFREECGGLVYKTMSDPTLAANTCARRIGGVIAVDGSKTESRMAYTTVITDQILNEYSAAVSTIPCMFQELIPKRVELRVTVIGDRVFAAEVDSQSQEETRIDWRHYDVPMRFRRGVLPSDLEDKCRALVRSYGLNFSAIDLIQKPDGEYVFLESNPNGQWYFVEQLVPELKMAEYVAQCLVHRIST